MRKIFGIFKELALTSGRLEKEEIIKNNSNNQLFKDVLYFIYNPYILTGISYKKINKNVSVEHDVEFNSIYEVMDYLKTHNSGRDIDIANMQYFISCQELEIAELTQTIITKSLKVGITSKTINKIVGKGFIPTFDVMLAKKYEEHSHKLSGKKFIITPKLDGVRVVFINGKFLTRQGQEIEGLNDIKNEIDLLPQDYVYDGELLAINTDSLSTKDLYRKTIKLSRTNREKIGLEFHIFDAVAVSMFKHGRSMRPCSVRKSIVRRNIDKHDFKLIKNVPILYQGDDLNMINKHLEDTIKNDEEGVMVQLSDSVYECKRTDSILKVKKMSDCDLKVVGFEEGSGKYKDNLGRINVEYKGNIVGVGSGFSDNMRKEIWNNQYKYLNKIAKIQYFEETKNQNNNKLSLRFPVFIEWRFDKDEPSLS